MLRIPLALKKATLQRRGHALTTINRRAVFIFFSSVTMCDLVINCPVYCGVTSIFTLERLRGGTCENSTLSQTGSRSSHFTYLLQTTYSSPYSRLGITLQSFVIRKTQNRFLALFSFFPTKTE